MGFNENVTPGHSTALYYGEVGATAATEIDNVEDVTPGESSVNDIDTSHMKSEEQWNTFMAGWKNAGEATATVQYNKTQHATLHGMVGSHQSWQVELQDGSTVDFEGYIKALGNPVEREGKVMSTLTIKRSGKPTFTAAA